MHTKGEEVCRLEPFDDLVLRIVGKTIRCVFGDVNAGIIFGYLEKKGCALDEVATKPHLFSEGLRDILGCGIDMLPGAAPILEAWILESLCVELKVRFSRRSKTSFADRIMKLREFYGNGSSNTGALQDRPFENRSVQRC